MKCTPDEMDARVRELVEAVRARGGRARPEVLGADLGLSESGVRYRGKLALARGWLVRTAHGALVLPDMKGTRETSPEMMERRIVKMEAMCKARGRCTRHDFARALGLSEDAARRTTVAAQNVGRLAFDGRWWTLPGYVHPEPEVRERAPSLAERRAARLESLLACAEGRDLLDLAARLDLPSRGHAARMVEPLLEDGRAELVEGRYRLRRREAVGA